MGKKYRKSEIIRLCEGKTVLHLGFIQHSHLYETLIKEDKWLHGKIGKMAKKLVGFDYLEKDVRKIKKQFDYECYYADVTKLNEIEYENKFEVIVCGELIEHLENPGLMLQGIKRYMNEQTILILTTPNPWSRQRIRLLKRGIIEAEWLNKEHTCWFSYFTLKQLLERTGYKEEKYDFYYDESEEEEFQNISKLLKLYLKLKQRFLLKRLPEYFQKGLFFVAKLK